MTGFTDDTRRVAIVRLVALRASPTIDWAAERLGMVGAR
jgi:hypothetical protein